MSKANTDGISQKIKMFKMVVSGKCANQTGNSVIDQ